MIKNVEKPNLALTVICTILFFPLGLYLIYRRFTCDKLDAYNGGKKLKTLAYILIGLGLFYIVLVVAGTLKTNDGSSGSLMIGFFVFGGLGTAFLIRAIKMQKNGKRYMQYKSIIASGQQASIDSLAMLVSSKPELVENDLQELINEGYFTGIYIDFSTKEIVNSQRQPLNQRDALNSAPQTSPTEIKPTIKTVKCPNCGGSNQVISGRLCECEFCSTPLS